MSDDPRQIALSAIDLTKTYGSLVALEKVNLEVRVGEFVALLGLNGAGKSTLLQLLTGLFVPDAGTIRILGLDVRRELTSALKLLGVVFQQPTLDLELTVEANLLYHTDLHGIPRAVARRRIETLLERFDLIDRRGDRARTLSGGNRRRVELSRSLLHEPKLLLMDEATVGLDPASRFDILSRIMELRDEGGLGVLWTTHLIDEVADADRVLVLHRGKLLFDGAPARLVAEQGGGTIDRAFLRLTTGDVPTARVALATADLSAEA